MNLQGNRPNDDIRLERVREMEPTYKCPEVWAQGPVRNHLRRVTDKFCYVVFILYLLAMIGTAIFALVKSDPNGISKVRDSSGNICGEGDTKDYPLLFLQTFKEPYRSVCVKSCPTFDYNQIKYNSTGSSSYNDTVIPAMDIKSFDRIAGPSHTNSSDMTEQEAFGYNDGWANGYFTEEQYNNYLKRFPVDCHTNNQFSSCQYDPHVGFYIYDSYSVMNTVCTPLSPKAALMFNRVSSKIDNGDLGDMAYALPLFGWSALSALGMSLVFLIIITCCTTLVTWFLVIGSGFVFIAVGVLIIISVYYQGPLNDAWNALRVKYLQYIIDHRAGLIIAGVAFILLGLFVFYYMCKNRKNISISIPLISVASRTSLRNVMLILLSIFIFAVQIGVLFLEMYIILKIYATGVPIESTQGSPFIGYHKDAGITAMIVLHAFGTYWLLVTLNNFNDFVCSAITVNYYWTSNIENMRIFCHTLGHHIGSIAWTFILLPIYALKICFGWIDWLLTSNNPNALQRFGSKLCCCCCGIYNRLVDSVAESFMAITYLGAEDFWPANRRYYYLSQKYFDEVSTISIVGNMFSLIGKLLITLATVAIAYSIYKESIEYQQNIDNIGLLFFISALIGFFVGSLFINLFSTTYEAFFTCFLIQQNIQDLSPNQGGAIDSNCPEELRRTLRELRQERSGAYTPL